MLISACLPLMSLPILLLDIFDHFLDFKVAIVLLKMFRHALPEFFPLMPHFFCQLKDSFFVAAIGSSVA